MVFIIIAVLLVALVMVLVTIISVRKRESKKVQKSIEQNRSIKTSREVHLEEERYRAIEKVIDGALVNPDNVEVYYQPVHSARGEHIVAAEALLRLFDDELGEIPPEEFIYVAEKNGTIVKLGQIAMRKVCEFIQNQPEGSTLKYVQINLSSNECLRTDLVESMTEIIEEYGIEMEKIIFEIKEGTLKKKDALLSENMDKLVDKGVQFLLDDYGTEASALTYIIKFPFTVIKVDRDVVKNALEDEYSMMALSSSINMIKDMNMSVVVEGVESKEAADKLRKTGCDYMQGFYYSKPVPRESFELLLTQDKAFTAPSE